MTESKSVRTGLGRRDFEEYEETFVNNECTLSFDCGRFMCVVYLRPYQIYT